MVALTNNWCWIVSFVWAVSMSTAVGQNADSLNDVIPYRRVFVPQNDLKSIGLEGYTPIEVTELEDLFENYRIANKDNAPFSAPMDSSGKSQLLTSHYVARLVGGDLVSERSRLSFSRTPHTNERFTLRPWSLALSSRGVSNPIARRPSQSRLSWSFDEQGLPRVPIVPTDSENATVGEPNGNGEIVHWIGWSAQSKANSLPNKLQFTFDIPRCADSCLVVALPPRAFVQDSATVARRIDKWSDIRFRLGDWSELAKEFVVGTSTRPPESLWLIELGGSQRASFSVALGVVGTSDSMNDESFRYSQLVKSQKLDHTIDGNEIRTTCDAEVLIGSDQQLPIRLCPAPESRLRRLTMNQHDVDWQVVNGCIEWNPTLTIDRSISNKTFATVPVNSKSIRVVADFVSPLIPNSRNEIETPLIVFDRGYVMSGSTVVQAMMPWRLTAAECESCRVVEPTTNNKVANSPIEFSWHAVSPPFVIGLEKVSQTRRCEMLTRLTNDEAGILAILRAKFYFLEQDSNHLSFAIAAGWNIRAITSIDRNDPVSIEFQTKDRESMQHVRLAWERIQRSRIGEIELQLDRESDSRSGKENSRRLPFNSILKLAEWDLTNTLSVEDSGAFRLSLRENLLESLVSEESIPDWQRTLLPRMNPSLLFRTNKVDRVTDRELHWVGKADKSVAKIHSTIGLDSSKTAVAVQHEIQLDLSSNRKRTLQIQLPAKRIRWSVLDDNKWISLQPLKASSEPNDLEKGSWEFDLSALGKKCILRGSVLVDLTNAVDLQIPLPRIIDAEIQLQDVNCFDSNISIHFPNEQGSWTFDDNGFKILKINSDIMDPILSVKVTSKPGNPQWTPWYGELNLGVDAIGSQRASLFLRSNQAMLTHPIAIEMEDNWIALDLKIRVGNQFHSIPFQRDGKRFVVKQVSDVNGGMGEQAGRMRSEGPVELRLDLAGPELANSSGHWLFEPGRAFQWPDFSPDVTFLSLQRRLWLPKELSVFDDSPQKRFMEPESRWPIWERFESLFKMATAADRGQAGPIHDDSLDGVVPIIAAKDWRIAMEQHQEYSSERQSSRHQDTETTYRIQSVSLGQSLAIILFAILAVVTPLVISVDSRIAAILALTLIVAAHLNVSDTSRFAFPSLIGMCLGFCVFVIYRLMNRAQENDTSLSRRNALRWAPWNDREEDGNAASTQSKAATFRAIATSVVGFVLYLVLGFAMRAYGQSPSTLNDMQVHQIVIPMDDSGELAGTNVYIPVDLRNTLLGKSNRNREELGTRPVAAKHILKVGSRGRADQIDMTYEFLVGENLSPVRFPFNSDQLQSLRFIGENGEINPGIKLRRVGTEWEWTPDKQGKQKIQVSAQPIFRSVLPDGPKEPFSPLAQQLDIALIPVGNAILEVEVDGQLAIDVISRGQVSNPETGRYVAMLGGVERLQCKVSSLTPLTSTSDTPVMNTELFIQGDILQAKTIIEYPKGLPISREIEIEADLQWLPVGTSWGDAHWVETRQGSTLSRRRYVLEWTNTIGNSNQGSVPPRDRQISVVWVPQSNSQSLNVVFAECLDRRTRLGTLRYSRAGGSYWAIEGVNTWVLPINSREQRLDWPELKTNPLAIALQIPFNGGFGILKPKNTVDRPQARVSSKWSIDRLGESLMARVELLGGSSITESLHVDLPPDFIVTDVYNRTGPIRFLQRPLNGRLRLQLLADRKSLELSDMWIQAKRPAGPQADEYQPVSVLNSAVDWQEIPWLNFPASINCDSTLEIIASDQIGLRIDQTGQDVLLGKGSNQSIASLTRTANDVRSNPMIKSRYQLVRRSKQVSGNLVLSTAFHEDLSANEIELRANLVHSIESRPAFVIEVPTVLKDRWQSDHRINPIPCPDSGKAWLQVILPETTAPTLTPCSILVQFDPPYDESVEPLELMSQVHALDLNSIATYFVVTKGKSSLPFEFHSVSTSTRDLLLQQFQIDAESEILEHSGHGTTSSRAKSISTHPMVAKPRIVALHQVLAQSQSSLGTSKAILESRYWIDPESTRQSSNFELEWELEPDVEFLSARIDGKPVNYSVSNSRAICPVVSIGLCTEVVIATLHQTHEGVNGIKTIDAPHLVSHSPDSTVFVNDDLGVLLRIGKTIHTPIESRRSIGTIAEKWLSLFARSYDSIESNIRNAAYGSDLDRWQNYWNQQSFAYLQQWSQTLDAKDSAAYSAAVEEWHRIRSNDTNLVATANTNALYLATEVIASAKTVRSERWYSLIGCLLILASLVLLSNWFATATVQRPWWSLLALGLFVWLFSGSLIPALVLGTIGLVVLMDSYLIFSERLRRIGLRGLR